MKDNEKKNQRIGLLTSLGVHGALLLLFLFAMAWRAPDPPLPEFGIEVNLGFEEEGTGDIQPETPTASNEPQPNEPVEEQTSEAVQETKPVAEEAKEEVVTTKQEGDVALKAEKETVKEVKKPEPEVKKELDKKLEYKKDEPKQEKQPENKGEQPVSQGNDKDKAGDKGEPKGTLDPNAQYKGQPGGGGGGDGMSLSMSGWAWADQPKVPNLPDNEDGRIVFEIECDAEGEIIGINTLERGLSPKAEQLLKEEIRKNSLVRTSSGTTPERSKGKVVFILKTK